MMNLAPLTVQTGYVPDGDVLKEARLEKSSGTQPESRTDTRMRQVAERIINSASDWNRNLRWRRKPGTGNIAGEGWERASATKFWEPRRWTPSLVYSQI